MITLINVLVLCNIGLEYIHLCIVCWYSSPLYFHIACSRRYLIFIMALELADIPPNDIGKYVIFRALPAAYLGDNISNAFTKHGIISRVDDNGNPTHVIHYGEDEVPSLAIHDQYGVRTEVLTSEIVVKESEWKSFSIGCIVSDAMTEGLWPHDMVYTKAHALIGQGKNLHNALTKNGEHFANWCTTGSMKSDRVSCRLLLLVRILIIIILLMAYKNIISTHGLFFTMISPFFLLFLLMLRYFLSWPKRVAYFF